MTTPTVGWMPCSDRSLDRDDPLAGTAGYGARWLLVEIDGAWGTHAFFQSRLDPDLGRELVRRVEAAGMRPLAIRRTGRRTDSRREQTRWRWAVVDARPGMQSARWGSVDDPAQLLDVPLDGSTGTPSDEPIICVCTHARHDQCCAVKGRPVVTALARHFPDATWECSHLGGDRFAATMVLFPHGLQYGRMAATDSVAIVESYASDRVEPRWLRGRTSLTNVVQAAESFARDAMGETRIDAFTVASERPEGEGWVVDLSHGDRTVTVRVAKRMSEPLLSTCSAVQPVSVREFALESVTVR